MRLNSPRSKRPCTKSRVPNGERMYEDVSKAPYWSIKTVQYTPGIGRSIKEMRLYNVCYIFKIAAFLNSSNAILSDNVLGNGIYYDGIRLEGPK